MKWLIKLLGGYSKIEYLEMETSFYGVLRYYRKKELAHRKSLKKIKTLQNKIKKLIKVEIPMELKEKTKVKKVKEGIIKNVKVL